MKEKSTSNKLISVHHLTNTSTWLRFIFTLLFAVIFYYLLLILVLIVAVVQFIFLLFTGKSNEHMAIFSNSLSTYSYQLIRYLVMSSEDKPFPFDRWPQS